MILFRLNLVLKFYGAHFHKFLYSIFFSQMDVKAIGSIYYENYVSRKFHLEEVFAGDFIPLELEQNQLLPFD